MSLVRFTGAPTREELLAAAGHAVLLPLAGARPEVHDAVDASRFVAILRALGAARALALRVEVETVITRSNARVLTELPPLLTARGVAAWRLVVARAPDDASIVGRVPRLALALPSALAALERARRLGLPATIEGAPLCRLGPMSRFAVESAPRGYASACARCAARPRCAGVDEAYLSRFGGGELEPLEAATPRA